ncbi:hypothetical protein DWF00_04685 [Bosea caraganae]|uniref:Uncharacterized protein n=1 Tax=Bosea caraganae TaxID=2763117 RepID=A0A370KZP6_9HYPH|nr:hypothetical protein [Bosea caraganae]RDJ20465.1 hypothetical protein DWE98_24395 [Bosea caraganae]RDJ29980.1 hypothetical protein DWF00_04685 [Bosea caraganae]
MTVPRDDSAAMAADERLAAERPHLSTDYLNRYGEALMLIEMAQMDPDIVDELRDWRPVGYREHFRASQLRGAPTALAAYDALAPGQRRAFEDVCQTMNRLIKTVIALLDDDDYSGDIPAVIDVASGSLRSLISRATQFINANGRIDITEFAPRALQEDIDTMFLH